MTFGEDTGIYRLDSSVGNTVNGNVIEDQRNSSSIPGRDKSHFSSRSIEAGFYPVITEALFPGKKKARA
jgi:hypothetical protein